METAEFAVKPLKPPIPLLLVFDYLLTEKLIVIGIMPPPTFIVITQVFDGFSFPNNNLED